MFKDFRNVKSNNNMLVKNTRIYFGWFQFQTMAIIKSPNKKKYSDLEHSLFNQENEKTEKTYNLNPAH